MTASRWDGSSQQALSIFKRWDGSSMVDLTIGKRWDGTTWTDVLPGGGGGGLSASIDSSAFGEDNPLTTKPMRVYTNAVTVTASGGTSPYTYAWTHYSGSSAIKCSSPSTNTTDFYAVLYPETSANGVWKCSITDSALNSVDIYCDIEIVYESVF